MIKRHQRINFHILIVLSLTLVHSPILLHTYRIIGASLEKSRIHIDLEKERKGQARNQWEVEETTTEQGNNT